MAHIPDPVNAPDPSRNTLRAFLATLPARDAERADRTLSHVQRLNGVEWQRHLWVEHVLARYGARIDEREGERAVVTNAGSYWLESAVTKAAVDYAAWIIAARGTTRYGCPTCRDPRARITSDGTVSTSCDGYFDAGGDWHDSGESEIHWDSWTDDGGYFCHECDEAFDAPVRLDLPEGV